MAISLSRSLDFVQDNHVYKACSPAWKYLQTVRPRTWALIGAVTTLALVKACVKRYVGHHVVLEVDLKNVVFTEQKSCTPGFLKMFEHHGHEHVHTLVRTLQKAAKDPRIIGLAVTMNRVMAMVEHFEELREAVLAMRAAGKKTLIYTPTFQEMGPATVQYWFASAFEEIYMCDIGNLALVGWKVQVPFLRQLMEKISAEPHLTTRRKYKTMANVVTEDHFTPEHKETMENILQGLFGQMMDDIAAARGLSVEDVRALVSAGPYTAQQALDKKLISGIVYEHEFYDRVLKERCPYPQTFFTRFFDAFCKFVGRTPHPVGVNLLDAQLYYKKSGGNPYGPKRGTRIALITIQGHIHMGKSHMEWDGTFTSAGADTIIQALREATDDRRVKAIILRIVSGGGSAVASDLIANQVLESKNAGKKIFVSMGQVAASGGYYIACYADKIVASPYTVTGSIGVVAGKVVFKNTLNKVGVTFDSVQTSPNADMMDLLTGYNEENKAKLEATVDVLYDKFKGHVAKGRSLTMDDVEKIAQGQVFTAPVALQHGLVDALGGLEETIQIVRQELALKEKEKIKLITYPVRQGFLARLKPVRNSRMLPRASTAAVAGAFSWLPQLCISIHTFAHMMEACSMITARADVKSLFHSAQMFDYSNFPNEASLEPSYLSEVAGLDNSLFQTSM